MLPDSECLSDRQLGLIRSFVANGGGLVATGQAGLYDEWRRLRVEPGLHGLADGQASAEAYEESPRGLSTAAGPPVRKQVGRGRAVYIPGVKFDGPMPEAAPYFAISNRFWKLPKNWQDIVASVRWAASDEIPLKVSGPNHLVANLVEQSAQRRWIVHLVNYDPGHAPIESIEVECRLPKGMTAKQVTLYSPDAAANQLRFTTQVESVVFTVPEVRTYSVVAVGW
ncbi:MAG TPA: hypothetical protein VJV74_14415 [Terriglobia bacterium]|nr:hypothetical protein [Terriglobia bacterium]